MFPLFQWLGMIALLVMTALSMAVVGMAICRAEVKAALRMADISHKEAALIMGISKGLLANKLSGEKPLTFESLQKLPPVFWQWFAVVLAHRYGVPEYVHSAARIAAIPHPNEMEGAA